jgi:hypothetical protein
MITEAVFIKVSHEDDKMRKELEDKQKREQWKQEATADLKRQFK